jgi:fibronectin-binding autotransporter adhesin
MNPRRAFLFLLGSLAAAAELQAATFNIGNGDVVGLRNAIVAANGNGQANTINLAAGGTYVVTSSDANHNGLPLIQSATGHLLTINGNNARIERPANGAWARFFDVRTDARIIDLTMANGYGIYGGGAVLNRANNLTLERCTFLGNTAEILAGANEAPAGGAVKNITGTVTVSACLFESNIAKVAVMTGGQVRDAAGGAIGNTGALFVTDSVFRLQSTSGFNGGTGNGGAIYNSGNASFARCTFTENTSSGDGGAIDSPLGALTLSACYFGGNKARLPDGIHNVAFPQGGAVRCGGQVNIFNCTFALNETSGTAEGGAIYVSGFNVNTQVYVSSCTFSRNSAGGSAASIYHAASSTSGSPLSNVIIRNTILDRHHANISDQNLGKSGTNASFTSQGYNICDDAGGGFLNATADQVNTEANLNTLPQDNGGPTWTIALPPGSPAIDKGHSFGSIQDQRGSPRPNDFGGYPNASGGDGTDVGAFEVIDAPQPDSSFIVNTNTDHNDGICGAFDCTLREAIEAANGAPSTPAITVASGVSGTIPVAVARGPLRVTRSMTITGPGARTLAVSGGGQTRVFEFTSGPTVISGLTIRDGALLSPAANGAGLTNAGALTVNDCTLSGNSAYGANAALAGATGGSAAGGAVHNRSGGSLTFNRCTFSSNLVDGGNGGSSTIFGATGGTGGSAEGGAIYNDTGSTVTLNNCTLANNNATGGLGGANLNGTGGNGGVGKGAGISNRGTLSLTACTVRNNNGTGGIGAPGGRGGRDGIGTGGVTNEAGGSATLRNSVIAENSGANGTDANGVFVSAGYNLIRIGDFGSGFNGAADQVGTTAAPIEALLGSLQNNGGPTNTMAPLPGSPALDRGHSFGLTSDQRGSGRPSDNPDKPNSPGGDGSEIGAYEVTDFLVVNTLADHDDGFCTPADCTLREAINSANAMPGSEVIRFRSDLIGTIQLTAALPILSTGLSIAGPGKDVITVRRNTGGNYRIFRVGNGTANGPTVSISRLTIANGRPPDGVQPDSGGGIFNDRGTLTLTACALTDNFTLYGFGGGLANMDGAATVEDCTFSGNTASIGGGAANYAADGASNLGSLTIRSSTFVGNQANSGGAIANYASGDAAELRLTNSTISANTGSGRGGGVYNVSVWSGTATAHISDSTLSGNASPLGGGLFNQGGDGAAQIYLQNDIFKSASGSVNIANSQATITSNGSNLSSDNGGGFLTATSDIRNTDPLLAPLAWNGGHTQTHALLPGSPAINAGGGIVVPPLDQRGYFHVGANDIGSYEYNGIDLRIISITRSGNDGVVTFNAAADRTFRLERRSDLNSGAWQSIPGVSDVTPTANGPMPVTDPGAIPLGRAFYRVRYVGPF